MRMRMKMAMKMRMRMRMRMRIASGCQMSDGRKKRSEYFPK
jgi:hypothetical protein